MKKFLTFFILLSLNCFAKQKTEVFSNQKNLISIRNNMLVKNPLKEEGKNKTLSYLHKIDQDVVYYTDQKGDRFHSKSDLLVLFKNNSPTYLKMFEKSYGLKLIRQLSIGDYLFKNEGKENTVELINRIIKEERNNLIRIYPNKTLSYIKR